MRALHCTLFSLFFASYPAQAALEYNLTPGVSPGSQDIYQLHMTVFWVCVAIGLSVFSVLFYSMLFHRKSRGVKPARFHEHPLLEIVWTLIPFFILLGLAIPGTQVLVSLNDIPKPDLTIKVTGYQWKWQYEYIDSGVKFFSNLSTPMDERLGKKPKNPHYLQEVDQPLVIPTHKKVRFLITANDVIHSWYVPALGVKRDGVPGFINEIWAQANRPGVYRGQCAQLCGLNHAFMPVVVEAKNEKEFNEWLQKKINPVATPASTPAEKTQPLQPATAVQTQPAPVKPAPAPTDKKLSKEELMKRGQQVYQSTCSVCHQPTGEGMPPLYPTLKGSPIVKGAVAAHIAIVLNGKPGTAMQAFRDQMNDEDLAAVITYERNSWENNTGDVIQPSQITAAKQQGPSP